MFERIEKLFEQLPEKPPLALSVLETKAMPERAGVYIIYSPRKRVLRVGQTLNLRSRLTGHRHGRSSFVRLHMKPRGKALDEKHTFKCMEIKKAVRKASP